MLPLVLRWIAGLLDRAVSDIGFPSFQQMRNEFFQASGNLSIRCEPWNREQLVGCSLIHRLDEFPAGYSSAGCSPALPASASPAGTILQRTGLPVDAFSANGDNPLDFLSHSRGSLHFVACVDGLKGFPQAIESKSCLRQQGNRIAPFPFPLRGKPGRVPPTPEHVPRQPKTLARLVRPAPPTRGLGPPPCVSLAGIQDRRIMAI